MGSQTRSQEIADTLCDAIKIGKYTCGDRLVELSLSQEFKVSQNTIRDALYILEQGAWVHKIPRRGIYIPTFTVTQAKEIYALWDTIENLALAWAMDNWDTTKHNQLQDILLYAERKVNEQAIHKAHTSIHKLHTMITLYASAPQTQTILSRIHNQVHLLSNQRLRIADLSLDEWDTRIEHYADVLHEIKQQHTEKAKHYLSIAIQYEAELVLPYLD